MSGPARITRRRALLGGVGVLAAAGGASAWALDRFVVDKPEVTNVTELESSVSPTSSTSTQAGISIKTWTSGSGSDLVTGYVADIRTSDATALRSAFAENTFGLTITANPSVIAEQVGAQLAINGDYHGFRDTGIVIRNGIAYRNAGARTGWAEP